MAGVRLLQIRTSFVMLEIHGPPQSRWGSIRGTHTGAASLAVESTQELVEVTWTDVSGHLHVWPGEQGGPSFFEDTRYRLWAKSLVPGCVPTPVHRDPSLLQDVDTYSNDYICAGPINFRRQVGLSTLEVRVGHETLRLTIEVFPAKLDYDQDYRVLLSEVASAARGLALEYLRATYRSGTALDTEHATGLEWVTLLRNEIDILEKSVSYVSDHPHRALSRETKETPVEKIKRVDASVRRAIIRGQGRGPRMTIPDIGWVHSVIPAVRTRETLGTPENRWLRLNLALIHDRLADLHASVIAEIARYEQLSRPVPKRLQAEEMELAGFVGKVKRLLALPIFDSIQEAPPPGFASLTLLGSPGYGDAYRAIMVLRLGLDVEGDPFGLSVMDVHDLYEAWCFIQLMRQVTSLIAGQVDLGALLQIEEAGIRVRLRRGEQSALTYVGADRTVVLSYNPEYAGLTGDQRPDIVLRFQHESWPDLVVVFDAKYRLDASEEYRRRFGTAGPPQDAINVLHRYRDAIVVDSVDRGLQRPVVKGTALFPLTAEESHDFSLSHLFKALEVLGIGALPFLPGNIDLVEEWLKSLLALAPEELAEPGPPFAGLSEKYRRASESTRA